MIDHQALMRVYGALMWSLGKVLGTPEVSRVYIGSFWDQPLRYDMNRKLFEAEEQDLFADLQSLPRNAALRKLNDLIKRARLAKVSTLLLHQSAISKHMRIHLSISRIFSCHGQKCLEEWKIDLLQYFLDVSFSSAQSLIHSMVWTCPKRSLPNGIRLQRLAGSRSPQPQGKAEPWQTS